MKHDFQERRNRRIANAKNRAEKNEVLSEQLFKNAKDMASVIPFGQPIMIGHHSEKGDRNYRSKISNTFQKSFEASEKAEYYAEKAKTIEVNDTISSDDPQAVQKLENKLKSLVDNHELMKKANSCIKKGDKDGFLNLELGTESLWIELNTPKYYGKGFPSFSLTNSNANIRQVKKRIEALKLTQTIPPVDKVVNGVRIFENREANRLQLLFDGKPEESVRKELKRCGFRWAPSERAWQRHISPNATYWALEITKQIKPGTT